MNFIYANYLYLLIFINIKMNANSTQSTTPIIVSSLEDALENKKISQKTYDRVKVAKDYIERKYKSKKYELHEDVCL